uniref:Uncharacterized protein n=1 Tax=Chlamydomonas leiostraca TaxID=1034604 RepID=A0A7S0S3N7_9CHLO|mmetsp:Transcript_6789/g.16921  ORF Transcript_6789/g.16921 Transcript_6789/m.16921 type:complete len:336 (+) Transcript_6789:28-1035(+)
MLSGSVQLRSCTARLPARPLLPARVCNTRAKRNVTAQAAKQDVLLRSLSDMGEVAVLVVDGTNLVAEAARRHQTAPTASAALGRALLGSLLMACYRKEEEVTQVTFKGDGPLGNIMTIADTKGNVKGKVDNPAADPPLRDDGKLNVGEAVGLGVLAVVRSHPLEPRPYTGMVPIISGEVAEDLANYLADSEQTNSALALGVLLDREAAVKHAGGFMVQVLPFCSEETLEQLEKNLGALPSVTTMLSQGMSTHDITERILEGLGVSPGAQSLTPAYGPCESEALKQRMIRAVASLGANEVRSIVEEQGKIEVTCDFCNETMVLPEQQVMAAVNQVA